MITELQLEQFRGFNKASFTFAPLTIITGNNGQGKTSILEAISMLSLTTSWKTNKDTEVISFGEPYTRIISEEKELVIQAQPYLKRMRINGVSKRVAEVLGYFPTILFEPDDMDLIYGAPSFRRAYLDRTISQTSPFYTRAILQVGKVLKQRNRLLKQIGEGVAHNEELDFWDIQLDEARTLISQERNQFLTEISSYIPRLFKDMVSEGPEVSFTYHQSPSNHSHTFLEHLKLNRFKEIAAGTTLYGPHREDVEWFWGEYPARQSMSRGQSRALLIACKMAELAYIRDHAEHKPVLLLDDIFSELDSLRRERLITIFGDYQVIMTTTDLGNVENLLRNEAQVIEL